MNLMQRLKNEFKKKKRLIEALGLTKVALEGLGKIPIVGPLLDTNKALDAAKEKAEAGGGFICKSIGAAMGSMGKSLASGLGDPHYC
jgi:hypothetical protein